MNTSVSIKRSVKVAALTVAFTASGSAMALAGTGPSTSGDHSILGGNQIAIPISIPVSVCGNALALLGDAFGACQGGSSVSGGSGGSGGGHATTSGNGSVGGGNQVSAPISVPVSICGNSVAVLGNAGSGCKGGSTVSGGSGGGGTTSGNHSVGGGNQVGVPISVPVDVCGNSVAVLGRAGSGCQGGASTGGSGGSGGGSTSGNGSVGGGNQVGVPISVPVDVCGNSISVLGNASSGCQGGSHTGPPPCHHCHHMPPPCHRHCHVPPPCHHRCHVPPPSRHHHNGGGSTVTARRIPPSVGGGSLPITGANFVGLLALAGAAIVSGAGALAFAAKRGLVHGLLAFTRRAATVR